MRRRREPACVRSVAPPRRRRPATGSCLGGRRPTSRRRAWTGAPRCSAGGAPRRPADVRVPAAAVLAPARVRDPPTRRQPGLAAAEHPLLGAVVRRPDSGGVVLTGRLSTAAHPWLADHAVGGTVLFPGAGFVELAIRAGDEVGCGGARRADAAAPLLLPAADGVQVQVVVGARDESGLRRLSVYSRSAAPAGFGVDVARRGRAAARHGATPVARTSRSWPPAGADPVDVAERLCAAGRSAATSTARRSRGCGRCGGAATRSSPRSPCRTRTPPRTAGSACTRRCWTPRCMRSALAAGQDQTVLPFAWQGVSLHAVGCVAGAGPVAPAGAGAVSVELADGRGSRCSRCGRLALRPVSAEQLTAAAPAQRSDGIARRAWSPIALGGGDGSAEATLWELGEPGGDVAKRCTPRPREILAVLQSWLRRRRRALVLAVQTRGAVALAGEDVSDLAGAAVWGLVRSAQAEHPGRIVLIDSDGSRRRRRGDRLSASRKWWSVTAWRMRRGCGRCARPPPIWLPSAAGGLTGGEGTLEDLVVSPCPRTDLTAGQVRVAVAAVGVNFRDVLVALGMYPGGGQLGAEGSGVVLEVGPDVTGLAVGDRVMGLLGVSVPRRWWISAWCTGAAGVVAGRRPRPCRWCS